MPVVALISDFGYEDAAIAVAKGMFLSKVANATIVDITHDVRPFNTAQAGYILKNCYESFLEGTFFVGLVDMFFNETPRLLLIEIKQRFFLVPDNGIMQIILNDTQVQAKIIKEFQGVHRLTEWLQACIDVISNGTNVPLSNVQLKDIKPGVVIDQKKVKCDVLFIDNYENVVLNITREEFDRFKGAGRFSLNFIQFEEIVSLSNNYTDVKKGAKLCRFNEHGFLEIAINNGRAASLFGLKYGSPHNKIYIDFS